MVGGNASIHGACKIWPNPAGFLKLWLENPVPAGFENSDPVHPYLKYEILFIFYFYLNIFIHKLPFSKLKTKQNKNSLIKNLSYLGIGSWSS